MEVVDKFLKYRLLPEEKKQQLLFEWEEYYKKCRESDAAKRYYEMKKAFATNNMPRIRELKEQARQALGNKSKIWEPSSIDPIAFNHNEAVQSYLQAERGIVRLVKDVEELEKANQVSDFGGF